MRGRSWPARGGGRRGAIFHNSARMRAPKAGRSAACIAMEQRRHMMKNCALLAALGLLAMAGAAPAAAAGDGRDDPKRSGSSQNIEPDGAERRRQELKSKLFRPLRRFLDGREVRSMDGSGNNKAHPEWGSTFTQFARLSLADYADGIAAMAGPLRKSAREISNIVIAQGDQSFPNRFGTSDILWQWGQFMDHDLTLGDGVLDEGPNGRDFDIKVPTGDPFFDPMGEGGKVIEFNRAIFDPATGFGVDSPRQQQNELTAWIDGSMVYGSSEERALALRALDGTGMLKTSPGGLLPFNVDNIPNANGPAPNPTKLFVAGDVRANEQPGLTAMHTLFVREHNRLARLIRMMRPWLSDEEIYQATRRLVIAEIQIITFEEFLPALIGRKAIPPYKGYQPDVDPSIITEFSGAAYRLGHTLINPMILRLDRRGREIPDGHLSLRAAFFAAPSFLKERDDIDPIFRGLASQKSQSFDTKIVDDLRNFLFGPPGAGGLDLASLNLQRGRDRGIPGYNDVRESLGMRRASDFSDISSNSAVQQALYDAYGTVDEVELWTGGLAEDPLWREGSQMGPVFTRIVAMQFARLRDGDRFWHERDLTRAELALVRSATLAKVIRANTKIGVELQPNIFYVKR